MSNNIKNSKWSVIKGWGYFASLWPRTAKLDTYFILLLIDRYKIYSTSNHLMNSHCWYCWYDTLSCELVYNLAPRSKKSCQRVYEQVHINGHFTPACSNNFLYNVQNMYMNISNIKGKVLTIITFVLIITQ